MTITLTKKSFKICFIVYNSRYVKFDDIKQLSEELKKEGVNVALIQHWNDSSLPFYIEEYESNEEN